VIAVAQSSSRPVVALLLRQWIALLGLCAMASYQIGTTTEVARYSTIAVFCVTAVVGALLCRRLQMKLGDPALQVTADLWMVKLVLTLFLMYYSWLPQLDPESTGTWGYDPQRYYWQAQELIDNNWIPDITGLNYFGILYYYGAIMALLGRNPLVPAFVNCFVTLIAVLSLAQFCYEIRTRATHRDWHIVLVLLFPELVWFDVLTSRETLVAALIVIFFTTAGRYLARTAPVRMGHVLLICAVTVVIIAGVRTSMLLPLVAALMLLIVFVRHARERRTFGPVVLAAAALVSIVFAPLIAGSIGGEDFSTVQAVRTSTLTEENAVAIDEGTWWAEDSIGRLFLPDNIVEAILFVPPRFAMYLVAPWPNTGVSVGGLLGQSWDVWQRLMVSLSALFNIVAMPYVLASAVQTVANRKSASGALVLHISYWLVAFAVAGGNLIIQERYRVMASMLLWACAWLGATTVTKQLFIKTAAAWYGFLFAGGLFYLLYKGL